MQDKDSSSPHAPDSSAESTRSNQELAKLADTRRVARLGLLTLLIGFGGFIGWAAFVPLDQGVPALGSVSVDTKRKAVQHLQGGIVRTVLVKEGEFVKQQQVLLRLDDAATRANYESIRQQVYTLRAQESRLHAEQLGKTEIVFDPALLAAARADSRLNTQMQLQSQLLKARRQSLEASLGTLRETALGYESIIATSAQVAVNQKIQIESFEKEYQGIRDMVRDGYLPVSRQLEMERNMAMLRSQIAENVSSQTRARQSILELKQRELAARADFQKEVEQQLAQLRPEIQAGSERFKAVSDEMSRTEIRAPAEGQVIGLAVQTPGSVIGPGQKVMDIVPLNEALVVEVKVEAHLIDRIKSGAEVDLRFSSFANTPQLVVGGQLLSVSADVMNENPAGAPINQPPSMPYYLARVAVTQEGMKMLDGRKLQPGMPVEVVFKTGQRTLLQYLLSPLRKRMAAALKEE